MKVKLFLSGGGSEKDSYDFDNKFINSLKLRKILYVPVAMERDKQGYESCYDWITSSLTQFDKNFVEISMCTELDEISNMKLNAFSAIYFGGGNTYRLLAKIYSSGLNKLLLKYIKNGGICYGGSAGAIIMGKSIETVPEENDKSYTFTDGLGLLGNFSLICHFDKSVEDKKKNIEKFLIKHRTPIIALPEGSGLLVDDEKIQMFGRSESIIFYPDGEQKKFLHEQEINLN
jgi:dipeptidase E